MNKLMILHLNLYLNLTRDCRVFEDFLILISYILVLQALFFCMTSYFGGRFSSEIQSVICVLFRYCNLSDS